MAPIKDGGPAFPKSAFYAPGTAEDGLYNGPEDGMTLRDYFAGQVLANSALAPYVDSGGWNESSVARNAYRIARNAYRIADAMLRAREAQS